MKMVNNELPFLLTTEHIGILILLITVDELGIQTQVINMSELQNFKHQARNQRTQGQILAL